MPDRSTGTIHVDPAAPRASTSTPAARPQALVRWMGEHAVHASWDDTAVHAERGNASS